MGLVFPSLWNILLHVPFSHLQDHDIVFDIKFKTLKNSSFWFQEAKGLLGNEKLGDTRQETKAKKGKPAGPKRTSTIAKTMQEGNSDNSHI